MTVAEVDTPCYKGKVKRCVTDDRVCDLIPGNLTETEGGEGRQGGARGGGEREKK